MTIKPVINQKSKDDGSEEQNQNVAANSPNRDKRKTSVFEETGPRHVRRTPQKSSNRMKRDHQKRLEVVNSRAVEGHSSSPYCPLGVNVVSATATTSLGHPSSPNALGNAAAQVAQSVDLLDEEAMSGYNSGDEHRGRDAGLTENEWKQRDEEFVKLMAKEGLIVKEMEEDGACLFRAISLQIYGDQDMHEDIRQQTMDYISQNREYFAQFMTEDISGYIARKRKKNVHGNHIEIQAMSEIYNRPVELYCYQSKPINIFNSEQLNNGYEPIRLSYQRSSHYNAILNPYKASVGVGLGLAGYQPDDLNLKQVQQAVRVSEELAIEQTMFEDKLKTTDWEATNEAIEEQIARESYLQWCRENLQRTKKSVSSTVTSQSSLSMPGSSSGSSMGLMVGGTGAVSTVTSASECNNNPSVSPLISCENPATSPTAIPGRVSPKQQQYQSDDGLKSCSGSSTCTSTASSSSSGSSSLLGSELGVRQRRRRRRHHHSVHANPQERGSDLHRASPPEMGGLNLLETRSTDSNDSDFSDETMSKKMKRRLGGEEAEKEVGQGEQEAQAEEQGAVAENRTSGSSVEMTEPGPSKSDPETTMNDSANFYHSLLEASYIEDGSMQMTEEEMIQRAIQMSRIDYITKLQKNSDYDSP